MSMGLCGNFPPQYSASVTFGTDPYDLFAVLSWLLFGIAQISLHPFNFNHKIYCHVFNTFQHGGKGVANAFNIAIQQNRKDVEANDEAVC